MWESVYLRIKGLWYFKKKKKTEKNAVIQIPVLRNAYHKLWNWADFDLNPVVPLNIVPYLPRAGCCFLRLSFFLCENSNVRNTCLLAV